MVSHHCLTFRSNSSVESQKSATSEDPDNSGAEHSKVSFLFCRQSPSSKVRRSWPILLPAFEICSMRPALDAAIVATQQEHTFPKSLPGRIALCLQYSPDRRTSSHSDASSD